MRHIFRKYYRLFSVSKYVLLLNISDKLYSFIIMLLLAREFSSEIFGEIVTLLTFAMVMQMIFDLGLPALIQREAAAGSTNYSSIFSVGFTFVLFLLPVYIGAGYLLKTILYPQADPIIFLIIFLFMYEALLVNVCNKALSGKEDYKSQFVSFFISRLYILIFFLWGLYFARLGLVSLMLVILSGFFLNLVLIFGSLDKNGINYRFKEFSFLKIKNIVTAAIPLGLAVIFNFMYDKIDVILISKLQDFNQVAYYNIGYGVYKCATIGFSFLLVSGYTTVSAINKDKEAVKEFFNEHAKVLTAICVISGILMFVFADLIIGFLYTQRYQPAAIVIKILSVGFIGLGLNNLTGITLNGMGYFKVVMYITLYGLIINVILNVFFIPLYGIKAASVISAATEYFIFFVQFYYLRKILG